MEDEPDRLPEFRMPTREELLQRPGMIAPIPARPIVVPRRPTNPQATLFEQPFLEPRIPTRRDLLRRRGMEMPNPLRQFYRDDEFIYLPHNMSESELVDLRRRLQEERIREQAEAALIWSLLPENRLTALTNPPRSRRYRRATTTHNIPARRE
jgi:hypothetical protein